MQDLTPRFPFAWLYDKNGNRQSETRNAGTMAYAYSPTGSNWLLQKGSDSRSKTANGNTASISGVASFSYDGFNRLATSVTASETTTYSYNALGERIKKINQNGLSTVFHYGTNGELLYERDNAGNTKEYVWLNGRPLARIDNGTSIYTYHVDHLGTPQAMTNSAGVVVWKGDYEPFGKATIKVSTIENNLRLPGQYFDRETGMHYNYFRDYEPTTGRYIETDPMGLDGGLNLYSYVNGNPVSLTDIYGLCVVQVRFKPVPVFGKLGQDHAYIVTTNPNGSQSYFRGGPDGQTNWSSAWGDITTKYGPYQPKTPDWDPGKPPSITIYEDDQPCDCINRSFTDILNKIKAANISYHPSYQNSNSVVGTTLKQSGFDPGVPPVSAPGYKTNLSY